MHSSMKTAALLCLVSPLLFSGTLGIVRFVTDDPARSDEYAESDLITMFALIRADLAAGQNVTIAAPPTILDPPVGNGFHFVTDLRDPNNSWIDRQTGLEYSYRVEGHIWNTEVIQESIRVLALETAEEVDEGGSSLRLDLTIGIEHIDVATSINSFGIWRIQYVGIVNGTLLGCSANLVIRYQTRFRLQRGAQQQAGQWILGPSLDQSVITVNNVNVGFAGITDQNQRILFDWRRSEQIDSEEVDTFCRGLISAAVANGSGTMDSFVLLTFGNRPYAAPRRTAAIAASDLSGYECRSRPSMNRRETKLDN